MNNQPIRAEDKKQSVRSIKLKPSEEELAKAIVHEEAIIYGIRQENRWRWICGEDKELYIRVARTVLCNFYHQIDPYTSGAPSDHGYVIYYKDKTASPSQREILAVIQNEFIYLEAYDVLVQAIMNVLQTCTEADIQ